ncbi:unnamed protein product, partial [Prorocentrum cordatum]
MSIQHGLAHPWDPASVSGLRSGLDAGTFVAQEVRARWLGGGAGDAEGEPRSICFGPAARDAAWRSALRAAGAEVLAAFPSSLPGVKRRLRGYLEGARRRSVAGPGSYAEAEDERAPPGARAAAVARSCGTAAGGRAGGARIRATG